MKHMETTDLVKKLEGVQTIQSVMALLNVGKKRAIYTVYRLRKEGYVKTKRLKEGNRVYNIAFENKSKTPGGVDYYELINKLSPVKLSPPNLHIAYGDPSGYEGALVFAIKTGSLRTVLASLALFKKIDDWVRLYHLAKANHVERQVGALYDLARKAVRTRRMSKQFRNNAMPKKSYEFVYIVDRMKSTDFKSIEDTWLAYLPFNKKDLEPYDRDRETK